MQHVRYWCQYDERGEKIIAEQPKWTLINDQHTINLISPYFVQ